MEITEHSMLIKRFDQWNSLKKETENKGGIFCHTREIWFIRMGENLGFEQGGKGKEFLRPVVIVKKFNNSLVWAVPLTSREKQGRYYFGIPDFNNRKNTAILSQIRLFDAKRLRYKIGVLETPEFLNLKKAISEILLSNDDF